MRYVWVLLLFLTVGCTSPVSYNLEVIPKYDLKQASKQYQPISQLQQKFYKLSYIYSKFINQTDQKDHDKIMVATDIYLYWSSVAMIQLFNGHYEVMEESLRKADEGLEAFESLLIKIIQAEST